MSSLSNTNATEPHVERVVRPDDQTLPPAPERVARGRAQRRSARVPYYLETNLYGDESFCSGVVTNLSKGGIFVESYYFFELDASVQVDIDLPGGRLMLEGRVAWVRDSSAHGATPGMGVAFIAPTAEQQEVIDHAVALACQEDEPDDGQRPLWQVAG